MAKKNKQDKDKNKKQKTQLTIVDPASVTALNTKDNETEANLTGIDITVPPPTPSSQIGLELNFQFLPPKLPSVDELKIPLVRRNGIKVCIDTLAEYFQCNDRKFNFFQFWFLDVVTDCLWKVQDEFRFPDELQKTVLDWILFIFDKMRDPQANITRQKLLKIFKESILIAAEYVNEGGTEVPPPEKLLSLVSQEPSERSTSVTSSISVHSSDEEARSAILFNTDNESNLYRLNQEKCECNQYDMSSIASVTESEITLSDKDILEDEVPDENTSKSSFEDLENASNNDLVESDEDYLVEELDGQYEVISGPSSLTLSETTICPSDIFKDIVEVEKNQNGVEILDAIDCTDKIDINEIAIENADMEFDKCSYNTKMKTLTKYLTDVNISAQRTAAMDDSEKGWVPSQEQLGDGVQGDTCSESEWMDIIDEHTADARTVEDVNFVNFGVLWAIIDFVFNYFYESFQFTLIKLAFRECPDIICQRVNQEWRAPKVPKGEFIPPPEKKEKKGKDKKGKKEKKGKSKDKKKKDKKSKSDKSSKKSKKDKGSKKDKKSSKKDKGSKKDKKKKEKPAKLTKEEKEELERLRLEQERIEEERRKAEENKRLMFPLNDAANDDLFNQIFERWVKVDLSALGKGKKDKKKGKDKKGKKGKGKKK